MLLLLTVIALLSLLGGAALFLRQGGKTDEKLKNQEAINDQNDELLEYLKKEKEFIHRLNTDADYNKRVRDAVGKKD